jgi:hypothetical protein
LGRATVLDRCAKTPTALGSISGGKAGGKIGGKTARIGRNKRQWTTVKWLNQQERPIKFSAHNPKVEVQILPPQSVSLFWSQNGHKTPKSFLPEYRLVAAAGLQKHGLQIHRVLPNRFQIYMRVDVGSGSDISVPQLLLHSFDVAGFLFQKGSRRMAAIPHAE